MTDHRNHHAFVLSRGFRDGPRGLELEIWGKGDDLPLHLRFYRQEAVMFVERHQAANAARRAAVELSSLRGKAVDALYFQRQRDLVAERAALRDRGISPFEADIKPVERFLMERFVLGSFQVDGPSVVRNGVRVFEDPRIQASDYQPQFSALSLDIETVGLTGKLLSLAGIFRPPRPLSGSTGDTLSSPRQERARVFLVRQPGAPSLDTSQVPAPLVEGSAARPEVVLCPDERSALLAFCRWVCEVDPDLLLGWNVIDFDLDYLSKLASRLKVPLGLGRSGGRLEVLPPRSESQPRVVRVPGRVVLDGIATLRNATIFLESYALDDVAQKFVGKGKAIAETGDKVKEVERMAVEDPLALARYNLQDCQLVLDIFDRARLFDFVIERQRLTGLAMDRQGGSVAAFDQLYLPRLHRAGFVAPSVGDRTTGPSSPGGYVLDSVPGLYQNVIVLDFKSLYPSIIRTFLVDPLGLALATNDRADPNKGPADSTSAVADASEAVPGYDGAFFARDGHILPGLIETLWAARDRAKMQDNGAMSQAIKIMMNSFYGVLGTPGCRFFDHRLVSSITKRGHEIIQLARGEIERRGKQVIYGDTDSLFVLLEKEFDDRKCDAIGRELAAELSSFFRTRLRDQMGIESHLELQYEQHYRRFFMPTMRGSEQGTKKRYVGATFDQRGELQLVFKGMEAVRTDWTPLARAFQRELFRRIFLDEPYEDYVRGVVKDLMRGALDDQLVYQKRIRRPLADYVTNVPPHVQAARKLLRPARRVRYVITVNGPEPVEERASRIDHEHYLLRQLAPAAEGILHALGADFSEVAGAQLRLFP